MSKTQDNALPPDLTELEDCLAGRPRPQGSDELRVSVLAGVRNELHRPRWVPLVVGVAMAASVLVAVTIWLAMRPATDGGAGVGMQPRVIAAKPAHDGPTVLAYRNAALASPQTLDELLDLHARTLLPKVSEGIDLPPWIAAPTSRKQ